VADDRLDMDIAVAPRPQLADACTASDPHHWHRAPPAAATARWQVPARAPAAPSAALAASFNAMPHMAWSAGADGRIDLCNDGWHDFLGLAVADPRASQWTAAVHPDEIVAARAGWQQCLATGAAYAAEHRLRRHDGAWRWTLARMVRVGGPAAMRWHGSFTDIHDLKLREDQLAFQACELAHRIHNIFAVVDGMVMLAARSAPQSQGFADAACDRIRALARANDHIRPICPAGPLADHNCSVRGLLDTLLAPWLTGADGPAPVAISGPDLPIGPSAAALLALAVHELATNAARHGALSMAGGQLAVAIAPDAQILRLVWRESGGPTLAGPPARRGFGTILTDRALGQSLGADVERTWMPGGLIVAITITRARLLC